MYESLSVSLPGKKMLAIPRKALLRYDHDTVVFVTTGQRKPDGRTVFKRRKVVVNEKVEGDLVPVLSGLKAGEVIAVDHSLLLLGMI
jgi:hypothetical protein